MSGSPGLVEPPTGVVTGASRSRSGRSSPRAPPGAARPRTRRASPSTPSRSVRPSWPPPPRAGSTRSTGGTRGRSPASPRPSPGRRRRLSGLAVETNSCIGRPSGNASGNASHDRATRGSSRSAPRARSPPCSPSWPCENTYAYARTRIPKLPLHPCIRPIESGRSWSHRERAVRVALDPRHGQERHEPLDDAHRSGPRPSPAVGRRERLVGVDVHDVETHVPRPAPAHDRVQVRAVVVDEAADVVHRSP